MTRSATRVRRWLAGRHRWFVALALVAGVAVLSAWVAFLVVPGATVRVGVVSADISAAPGSGTVIRAVEGRPVTDATVTRGPLQVRVNVAFRPSPAVHEPQVLAGLDHARGKLVRAAVMYLLRVAAVAAALAVGVALMLFGRARKVFGAAVAASIVVGTSAAATAGTVRAAAFDAASCTHGWSRYALADLPELTPPAPQVRPPVDATAGGNPGLVAVELIADNHLNPEGLKFALNLARRTGAQAVLDAGDTTSYGVPGEDCVVVPLIRQFHVPYVWVRGNHDSAAFADEMRHVPGVRELNASTTTVAGMTVFGDADPSFTPHAELTTAQMHRADATVRAGLPAQLAALDATPDVVLVHDCLMALSADAASPGAAGIVPLIACGHLHRFSEQTVNGTTVLHTGTVGAGGIAALQTGQLRDFGATLMFFDPTTHRLVTFFDVEGAGGRLATFTAHVMPAPAPPPVSRQRARP